MSSYMHEEALVFYNGQYLPFQQAGLSLNDVGVLRGYGVCEVLRTCNRRPLAWEMHLQRLRQSAAALHLQLPYSDQQLLEVFTYLQERNSPTTEASIKIVLTGGPSEDGFHFNPKTPTLFVRVFPFVPLPEWMYKQGVRLVTHQHERYLPESKSLNYLAAVQTGMHQEAFEVLFCQGETVLEAATSNIFCVSRGVILTPAEKILSGITRKLVLELARKRYSVEERSITLTEVLQAEEVFLTATNKDILPVVQIDQSRIADGKVGPVSKRLLQDLRQYMDVF